MKLLINHQIYTYPMETSYMYMLTDNIDETVTTNMLPNMLRRIYKDASENEIKNYIQDFRNFLHDKNLTIYDPVGYYTRRILSFNYFEKYVDSSNNFEFPYFTKVIDDVVNFRLSKVPTKAQAQKILSIKFNCTKKDYIILYGDKRVYLVNTFKGKKDIFRVTKEGKYKELTYKEYEDLSHLHKKFNSHYKYQEILSICQFMKNVHDDNLVYNGAKYSFKEGLDTTIYTLNCADKYIDSFSQPIVEIVTGDNSIPMSIQDVRETMYLV